jgi:anti-sigma factor (TIGR02949 family)
MSAARPSAGPNPGDGDVVGHDCECDEAIDRLFEYLDAEMPESDTLRVAAHLAACHGCEDAAGAERHVRELLRRSCQESAPETLRIRVVAQLMVRQVRGSLGAD